MGGHTDEPSVTADADGYMVPQLCDHPGLVCCMVDCATNVHRLWLYHADTHIDRHHICSICIGKWPDLRCNFGILQPVYNCTRQPADVAAAGCFPPLPRPSARRQAATAHGCLAPWMLVRTARTARPCGYDACNGRPAALELQCAKAIPHDADASVAHTATQCTSLRTAAAAAESSSRLASVAETHLSAALLAAQRLREHAHRRLACRVLVMWHTHAAVRLTQQAHAA